MIKQIKLSFKLLKYAYGIPSCSLFALLFLITGIVVKCIVPPGNFISLLIMYSGLWVGQLFYSFGVSKWVRSSAWVKKIETSMLVLLNIITMLALYGVVVIISLIQLQGASEKQMTFIYIELVISGVIASILMLSLAFAYKYFFGMMLFFCLGGFFGGTLIGFFREMNFFVTVDITLGKSIIIGVLMILLGGVLQYGLSMLIYRKPISKWSQLNALSKHM